MDEILVAGRKVDVAVAAGRGAQRLLEVGELRHGDAAWLG